MNLFYFKISTGYKNVTNCLIKFTLSSGSLLRHFEEARSGCFFGSLLDPSLLDSWWILDQLVVILLLQHRILSRIIYFVLVEP